MSLVRIQSPRPLSKFAIRLGRFVKAPASINNHVLGSIVTAAGSPSTVNDFRRHAPGQLEPFDARQVAWSGGNTDIDDSLNGSAAWVCDTVTSMAFRAGR